MIVFNCNSGVKRNGGVLLSKDFKKKIYYYDL